MFKLFVIIYIWSWMIDSDMEMAILKTRSWRDAEVAHSTANYSAQSVSCTDWYWWESGAHSLSLQPGVDQTHQTLSSPLYITPRLDLGPNLLLLP